MTSAPAIGPTMWHYGTTSVSSIPPSRTACFVVNKNPRQAAVALTTRRSASPEVGFASSSPRLNQRLAVEPLPLMALLLTCLGNAKGVRCWRRWS